MIPSTELSPLINSAFTKQISWLEAANHYSLDEFIETFYQTRTRALELLEGLDDSQVAFASDVHPFWTISESITHLIYSQGFYLNTLLDIATSQMPHVVEAARGLGEGAKQNVPAELLRKNLIFATEQIKPRSKGRAMRTNRRRRLRIHYSAFATTRPGCCFCWHTRSIICGRSPRCEVWRRRMLKLHQDQK
ncbi:MAG: DinB family protein [Anaerolineae bacterium]